MNYIYSESYNGRYIHYGYKDCVAYQLFSEQTSYAVRLCTKQEYIAHEFSEQYNFFDDICDKKIIIIPHTQYVYIVENIILSHLLFDLC